MLRNLSAPLGGKIEPFRPVTQGLQPRVPMRQNNKTQDYSENQTKIKRFFTLFTRFLLVFPVENYALCRVRKFQTSSAANCSVCSI